MASKQRNPECKFNTAEFRVSYASVFKPKVQDRDDGTQSSYYQFDALFPKDSTDMEVFETAFRLATEDEFGKDAKKMLANPKFKIPLKDGDEHENEEYRGHWYINIKSSGDNPHPPVLSTKKGADGKFIACTERDFYSGCWARANVTVSAFNHKMAKGVSVWYNGLQKIRDDDQFGGSNFNAEESFADMAEDYENDFGKEEESSEKAALDW